MSFVHLHVHSHYSLLDGLAKIDDLIEKAKADGMPALALTDHGVMYGIVEFYQKCKKAGIKPILGVEAYVARNGRHSKQARVDDKPYHLILLAKNAQGYKNLIKLTSLAHLEGFYYKPRIDWELLEKYNEGLIASSACLAGELPTHIRHGEFKKAEQTIRRFQDIFGDDFYLEIQHNPSIPDQRIVNEKIMEYSSKFNIPIIGTNDVHYLNTEDDQAHDVLICMQTKRRLEEKDRMSMMGEDFSMRKTEQVKNDFSYCPQAVGNTLKVAEKCNVELDMEGYKLPHYEVPGGKSDAEYLRELCEQGMCERYGYALKDVKKKDVKKVNKDIMDRLDFELSVIERMGFPSYFLIVQDFVNWAKDQGIVVGPGRGSAAGSLVSYLINITDLDPLHYNLLFERFLNPDRVSMPDIDLDFADSRRGEVLEYVSGKYGRDHVAQIITFGTMAARAAVKDVGRVLDMPYDFCDKLAKLIPMGYNLKKALEEIGEFKEMYDSDERAKKIIDTAMKLEGVARHSSIHACGVVITNEPLDEYAPVQYASSGDQSIVSQYSLHPVEDLGLLKMDFLGLKNLTLIENALEIIEKTAGDKIDINNLDLHDKKTLALFQRGETTGIFQFESAGMKRYLRELKPTDIEDLIAMNALYRPGPMELIPDFIAGKHGFKRVEYIHPKLKNSLEKTYGVAVYQEQVMQMARDLAGFTPGEADVLRKAMGKKIKELLEEQKEKFIRGCEATGVGADIGRQVFAFIEPFAGYGFNRSHAACYAYVAFQTAFLKSNYPVQFMAALLTADQGDIERAGFLVDECRQMGIEVLPPDINESFKTFTAVKEDDGSVRKIRFGLKAIKNVGEGVVDAIIKERKANGQFKNLEDLLQRVRHKDMNKKSLESMVKSGALDKFGDRNKMAANIERMLEYIKLLNKEAESRQNSLFGTGDMAMPKLELSEPANTDGRQILAWEKEYLGLYISEHPFKIYEEKFKDIVDKCANLRSRGNEARVLIAGVITTAKKIITKKGDPMLFAGVEDTSASTEILVFPKLFKEAGHMLEPDKIVAVSGKTSDKDGDMKVLADKIYEITPETLDRVLAKLNKKSPPANSADYFTPLEEEAGKQVCVCMEYPIDNAKANELKTLFSKNKGGTRVMIEAKKGMISKKVRTNYCICFDGALRSEIEKIVGPGNVIMI